MAAGSDAVTAADVARLPISEADGCRIVLVDGRLALHLSDTSQLPSEVFLGSLADAPEDVACRLVGMMQGS